MRGGKHQRWRRNSTKRRPHVEMHGVVDIERIRPLGEHAALSKMSNQNLHAQQSHESLEFASIESPWVLRTGNSSKSFEQCFLKDDRRVPTDIDKQRRANHVRADSSRAKSILAIPLPGQAATAQPTAVDMNSMTPCQGRVRVAVDHAIVWQIHFTTSIPVGGKIMGVEDLIDTEQSGQPTVLLIAAVLVGPRASNQRCLRFATRGANRVPRQSPDIPGLGCSRSGSRRMEPSTNGGTLYVSAASRPTLLIASGE